MVNNAALADSAEQSIELLFVPYFTLASDERRKPISESDVRQISDALRRMGKISWSQVPRIYTILRIIDQIQVIDSFVAQGVSDIWFPFTQKSLPDVLRSLSSRSEFLAAQDLVLTKAFDLEREDGKHRHFARARDVPLRKIEELGKGGSGYVDRVVSTITYREYARKLIPRGRTFRKDQQVLKDFERELGHLKRLSHIHIVELVGSYTEPKFVGLIMSPVAECNLKDFLAQDPISSGDHSFLRTFFGCLAEALCYLHENQIRHKDIKPQNVLVKGHQILLTDFGISLDWSDIGIETTSGPTMKTPRYCAPEVADFTRRNSFSDIWSLGCVFLEMWTVLQGGNIRSLLSYLESNGSKSTCYFLNINTALAWCNSLKESSGTSEDNTPLLWIVRMMKHDQDDRWTARALLNNIDEVNANPENRFTFSGLCCIGDGESTDNTCSSNRTSTALDETTESQIGAHLSSTKILKDATGQRMSKSESIFFQDHQSQKPDTQLLKEPINHSEGQAHTKATTVQLTAAAPGIVPTSEGDLNAQRLGMHYLNQECPVQSDDIRMDETSGDALNAPTRTSGSLRPSENVQGKIHMMRDAIFHEFEDDDHHFAASILPSQQAAAADISEDAEDRGSGFRIINLDKKPSDPHHLPLSDLEMQTRHALHAVAGFEESYASEDECVPSRLALSPPFRNALESCWRNSQKRKSKISQKENGLFVSGKEKTPVSKPAISFFIEKSATMEHSRRTDDEKWTEEIGRGSSREKTKMYRAIVTHGSNEEASFFYPRSTDSLTSTKTQAQFEDTYSAVKDTALPNERYCAQFDFANEAGRENAGGTVTAAAREIPRFHLRSDSWAATTKRKSGNLIASPDDLESDPAQGQQVPPFLSKYRDEPYQQPSRAESTTSIAKPTAPRSSVPMAITGQRMKSQDNIYQEPIDREGMYQQNHLPSAGQKPHLANFGFSQSSETGKPLSENLRKPNTPSSVRQFSGQLQPTRAAPKAFKTESPQPTHENPWYLQLEHPTAVTFDLNTNPPQLRSGSLLGLVEQLTRHDRLDASFNGAFLLTYRTFTTDEELFSLLIHRYNLQPPAVLSREEYQDWERGKQKLVRIRVFNILRSWFEHYWMEEVTESSQKLLDRAYKFVQTSIASIEIPGSFQLISIIGTRLKGKDAPAKRRILVLRNASPLPILPLDMKKLTFLKIDATELARQLTIVESQLYCKITPLECLDKTSQKNNVAPNVKSLIQHANQVTSWVAEMILQKSEIKKRVSVIKHFVAIADKCRSLNNFSTLMSIIAALGAAPILRLNRTWAHVNPRTSELLESMRQLMASPKNFGRYRERLHGANPPCIPFLVVHLRDLKYIENAITSTIKNTELINFVKCAKTAEVICDVQQYQNVPYSLTPLTELQEWILEQTRQAGDIREMYNRSLLIEPREREEEKIARMLSESGFM